MLLKSLDHAIKTRLHHHTKALHSNLNQHLTDKPHRLERHDLQPIRTRLAIIRPLKRLPRAGEILA